MSIVLVLAELEDARRRIAELEAQLAAVKPKARKPRAVAGEACQYCGDRKSRKQEFLGLPMCSDWRPCAARMRRGSKAGDPLGYAWDKAYTVRRELNVWTVRYLGEMLGSDVDRGAARRLASAHRDAALGEQVAA